MRKTVAVIGFLFMILMFVAWWIPKLETHAQGGKAIQTISQSLTTTENGDVSPNSLDLADGTNVSLTLPVTSIEKDLNNTVSMEKELENMQKELTKGEEVLDSVNQHRANFYYEVIPDSVKARIKGKSYGENCDVPFEDLRYVGVLYWGFDQTSHKGELIVNKEIAKDTVDIFEELYEKKYPIERVELVDEYNADDIASMAANNSSSFNYRNIDGTKKLSLHSYGLAIDINPRYNPYVRGSGKDTIITPQNGTKYADRSLDCPYYINKNDICYQAFIKRGFTWGGEWDSQKDYQHFQKANPR